jgi:hypothetical protein
MGAKVSKLMGVVPEPVSVFLLTKIILLAGVAAYFGVKYFSSKTHFYEKDIITGIAVPGTGNLCPEMGKELRLR